MRGFTSARKLLPIVLWAGLIIVISCENDIEPNIEQENDQPTPTLISGDLLELQDATQIPGDLPAAPDAGLKINYEDTIYLVYGDSYRARIKIYHDPATPITGVNLWFPSPDNAYFFVPKVITESSDSITIVYIGPKQLPEDTDFPVSFPVKIQPVSPHGTPVDEFDKDVTIEDPEDTDSPCNDITRPVNNAEHPHEWMWYYTEIFGYNSDSVFQITAPGYHPAMHAPGITYSHCCLDEISYGANHLMHNGVICKDTLSYFRETPYKTYSTRTHEYMFFYPDHTFVYYVGMYEQNLLPQESCYGAVYDQDYTDWVKVGTHDFSPGADKIKITYEKTTGGPGYGPFPPSGDITYTCHMLILEVTVEQKIRMYYGRRSDNPDNLPRAYHHKFD